MASQPTVCYIDHPTLLESFSQKWYFGHSNEKLLILEQFFTGMTSNSQRTLFDMYTMRKWKQIKIFKPTQVDGFA